ncbi:MAG: endonuclease [Bacteroidota bacterium]
MSPVLLRTRGALRLAVRILAAYALAALVGLIAPQSAQAQTVLYPGLEGQPLIDAIRADFTPTGTLGYGSARDSLYAYEQRENGAVCGIYTQYCIQLTPGADPSSDAFGKGVNAEHTYPQSLGAGSEPARSDLHNLFPAKANVNSSRSNHPFAEIPDAQADAWYRDAASQSNTPTADIDAWSEKANTHPDPDFSGRFEPREDRAGDIARAAFYFYTIYPSADAAFFAVQKDDLMRWHYQDATDQPERDRSAWIAIRQGGENPFVLDSTLARRAFGLPAGGIGGPGTPPGPGADPLVWVNEVHYDNTGADTGEGIEIAGPAGTDLAGYDLALYNGNGGGAYQTVALSGTIEDQQGGYGTAWFAITGLQNGSPDGFALVTPAGAVTQFLSYEGTLTATSGPASGMTSTDIGVQETSSTPLGYSLQLGGSGDLAQTTADDFAWEAPQAATPGAPNANQTLGDGTAPAPAVVLWINELHYDNAGADRNEGVEVAGTAGADLAGYTLVAYNGNGGRLYQTRSLSGTLDAEGGGLGAAWFAMSGLQNGSPDGVALVDPDGAVLQFLSYEGAFTAADGPAAGLESTDVGVQETGSTQRNRSLQLVGTGSSYADFTWTAGQRHTRGSENRGQTFGQGAAARIAQGAQLTDAAIYPNPATNTARLALGFAEDGVVRVEVFDVLGRRVLVADQAPHDGLDLNVRGWTPGVYIVRAQSEAARAVLRFTVTR